MESSPAEDSVPLIDVHAHFVTDFYVAEARAAGHVNPDGMPGWPEWHADSQVAFMDRHGIGTALLSVSSPGTHFGDDDAARSLSRRVNEFAAAMHVRYRGRFGHLAALPLPDIEGRSSRPPTPWTFSKPTGWRSSPTTTAPIRETHGSSRYGRNLIGEAPWCSSTRPRRRTPTRWRSAGHVPCSNSSSTPHEPPRTWCCRGTRPPPGDLLGLHALRRRSACAHRPAGLVPLRASQARRRFGRQRSGAVGRPLVRLGGNPFPHQAPALAAAFGTGRLLYGSDSCWTPDFVVEAHLRSLDTAPPPSGAATWRALTTYNARRLLHRTAGFLT